MELGSQFPVIITQVSPGAQVYNIIYIYTGVLSLGNIIKNVHHMSVNLQVRGVRLGQQVLAINGNPVTILNPTEHFRALKVECGTVDSTNPEKARHSPPPPLYLTIVRRSSEFAVLSPKGSLGFNVKGSSPVVVSNTDRGTLSDI